jgi:hypothetical protein
LEGVVRACISNNYLATFGFEQHFASTDGMLDMRCLMNASQILTLIYPTAMTRPELFFM